MTQKSLILKYIKLHGSIVPAKMAGEIVDGEMLGSETSKRCREMRAAGLLTSEPDGKFERFKLKTTITVSAMKPEVAEVISNLKKIQGLGL